MKNAQKRSTNVSLAAHLVEEAKELGVNISQASEKGLIAEISIRRRDRWQTENRSAMDAWNDWIEENGMPLSDLREF